MPHRAKFWWDMCFSASMVLPPLKATASHSRISPKCYKASVFTKCIGQVPEINQKMMIMMTKALAAASERYSQICVIHCKQWRQRLGNFGGMDWRKWKSPSGVLGQRPNRRSSGRIPQARGGLAHWETRKFPGGPLPNYKILKLQISANSLLSIVASCL